MYIQQAFKYQHDFWRYLVGVFIIIVGVVIGQLPFLVALIMKSGLDMAAMDESQMMKVLDSNITLFFMLLTFAVGLVALLLVVKFLHNQPLRALTTARDKIDWGRVFFGFGIISVFVIGTTVIDYYSNPEDYIFAFEPQPFLIMLVIAIIMIPLQTSFEEYLFRGYLMQGIGIAAKNRWLPLILTSLIFGGLHFFNPEVTKLGNIIMIYYIGTGFLLGIMTLMDDGMELALGFHAGNNLLTAVLVTADWTAFQTNSLLKDISEPTAGLDILIPVLVVYPIFLLIMAKRYKWSNWGNKLFGKVEQPEVLKTSEDF